MDWQVSRGAGRVQALMQGCRARRRGHCWTDTGYTEASGGEDRRGRAWKTGAWVNAMLHFSVAASLEQRQPSRHPEHTQPHLILLSQPYLIDPREYRHELAEDGRTDAGNVDKGALGKRRRGGVRSRGPDGRLGGIRCAHIYCPWHHNKCWKHRSE